MSALLDKLVLYTVERNTPDHDLREKAIGIVLKSGYEFRSVVVDKLDADNKVLSGRDIKNDHRECHILVDEIATVLAPTAPRSPVAV